MKTSEVLNKAADLIEQRGWAQGGGAGDTPYRSTDPWGEESDTAPLCLEGAIFAAAGWDRRDERWGCPAYRAVDDYLGLLSFPLFFFNDEPGRTPEEVVAVLRGAALVESVKETASEPAKVTA